MRRRGMSLMEVLLALAIFLGSLAVLGELVRLGTRNAIQARERAEAERLCATKLTELATGMEEAVPVAERPLDESGDWLYSVEREATTVPELFSLRVTVRQNLPEEKRPVDLGLVQWVRLREGSEAGEQPSTNATKGSAPARRERPGLDEPSAGERP